MFSVREIRDTLDQSNYGKSVIVELNISHRWYNRDAEFVAFDMSQNAPFYYDIANMISRILNKYCEMSLFGSGLTVSQIGKVMDKIGEPWTDFIIATSIQYLILEKRNEFYSISQILKKKYKYL